MKYSEILEHLAALSAFLLPIYIASVVYYMIRTRQFKYLDIIQVLAGSIVVTISYIHLQPMQRLYALGMMISIIVIFALVMAIAKLFKWR
jgi:hypothetical protein